MSEEAGHDSGDRGEEIQQKKRVPQGKKEVTGLSHALRAKWEKVSSTIIT